MSKAAGAFLLYGAHGETLKLEQTVKEEEGLQGVRTKQQLLGQRGGQKEGHSR